MLCICCQCTIAAAAGGKSAWYVPLVAQARAHLVV